MQELRKCKKVLVEVNQTCNLNCTYCNISKNKTSDHFVDINKMVDIGSGADILDNLGSEELGANIFRITQT